MTEDTLHTHRCACGTAWICGRKDCSYQDACAKCEADHYEAYAERRGWTISQPEIPELAAAGFVKEN